MTQSEVKGQIFSRYIIENLKDQKGRKGIWRGGSVVSSEGTSVRRQRLEKAPRRWTYRCHCGIVIADRVMRSRFPSCDSFADGHGICSRNSIRSYQKKPRRQSNQTNKKKKKKKTGRNRWNGRAASPWLDQAHPEYRWWVIVMKTPGMHKVSWHAQFPMFTWLPPSSCTWILLLMKRLLDYSRLFFSISSREISRFVIHRVVAKHFFTWVPRWRCHYSKGKILIEFLSVGKKRGKQKETADIPWPVMVQRLRTWFCIRK